MKFVGQSHQTYEKVLFIVFATIAAILCAYQIVYLQKLNLLPVYLIPFLSFFLCFENVILFYGKRIDENSDVAQATYVFYSLQIPIFMMILFEMVFRLHQLRSAHFFFIPFDEDAQTVPLLAILSVILVRFIAAGLFVMNILSTFELVYQDSNELYGGYTYLASHMNSEALTLQLVPTIVLSFVATVMGVAMYRYGNRVSFQSSNNQFWKLMMITGIGYFITNIFGPSIYAWTLNLGSILLLFSSTVLIQLVQDDLELARSYAAFLRVSNCAFQGVEENRTGSSRTIRMESLTISVAGDQHMRPDLTKELSKMSMPSIFPDVSHAAIVEMSPTIDAARSKNSKPKLSIESTMEQGRMNNEDIDRISNASSWDSPERNSNASTPKFSFDPNKQPIPEENNAIAKSVLNKESYLPL